MQHNPELALITTADELHLPGLLFKPQEPTKKAALYLHGNGDTSIFYAVPEIIAWAEALTVNGIAFFPFNNRGAHARKSFTKKMRDETIHVVLGSAHELIQDCVLDIDAAIVFLQQRGYTDLVLIGHSTGANKIVVYDRLTPHNAITKYVLLAGGDDTGIYYNSLGKEKFLDLLTVCREKIEAGKGADLVPKSLVPDTTLSYQSLYDIINPDGEYNQFPFCAELAALMTKEPFGGFKSLHKPTLSIYGELDEYCLGLVSERVEQLKSLVAGAKDFQFEIIPGANHSFEGKEAVVAGIVAKYIT